MHMWFWFFCEHHFVSFFQALIQYLSIYRARYCVRCQKYRSQQTAIQFKTEKGILWQYSFVLILGFVSESKAIHPPPLPPLLFFSLCIFDLGVYLSPFVNSQHFEYIFLGIWDVKFYSASLILLNLFQIFLL